MAFAFDEIFAYGGQLIVAAKKIVPKALGVGKEKVDHTAYIQGNTQIGKVDAFSDANATLMIGREDTIGTNRSLYIRGNTIMEGDSGTPFTLNVNGDVTIVGNTKQTGNTVQTGTIKASGTITASNFVGSVSSASGKSSGAKAFDIPHPSKEGYRLRHICVEGPESAVYYRGRTNKNIIPLPLYWKDLIDMEVESIGGEFFGKVIEIIEAGSTDVIVVKDKKKKSILIPFIFGTYIKEVKENKIYVNWERDD